MQKLITPDEWEFRECPRRDTNERVSLETNETRLRREPSTSDEDISNLDVDHSYQLRTWRETKTYYVHLVKRGRKLGCIPKNQRSF